MRTPARASAFADSLRLGDTVIGLFCGRWMLMALNPSMGSDPMEALQLTPSPSPTDAAKNAIICT